MNPFLNTLFQIERFNLKVPNMPQLVGLHPVTEWKAYTLAKHPGT